MSRGEPPLWWAITDATARRIRVRIRPRRRWTPRSSGFTTRTPRGTTTRRTTILRDRHVIRLADACSTVRRSRALQAVVDDPDVGAGGGALVNSSSYTEAGIPRRRSCPLRARRGNAVAAVPISRQLPLRLRGRQRLPQHRRRRRRRRRRPRRYSRRHSRRHPGERRCVLALVAESNCERRRAAALFLAALATTIFAARQSRRRRIVQAWRGIGRSRRRRGGRRLRLVHVGRVSPAVTPAGVEAGLGGRQCIHRGSSS